MATQFTPELSTSWIDNRAEGRDIEKLFDSFVEQATDIILDELPYTPGDDDELDSEVLDYVTSAVFARFGYFHSSDARIKMIAADSATLPTIDDI